MTGDNVLSDEPQFTMMASNDIIYRFTINSALTNIENATQRAFENKQVWPKQDQTTPPDIAVLDENYQIIGNTLIDIRTSQQNGSEFVPFKTTCNIMKNKLNSKHVATVSFNMHVSDTMEQLFTN